MEFIKKLFTPVTETIKFIQRNFKAVVFLTIVALLFIPSEEEALKQPNLETLTLEGPIFDADELLEKIDEIEKDDAIKGVLFRVNSPGGAIAPSIEIAEAIKRLDAKKPVVVYSSGILASGSYYASIYASKIVANPGTLVGSIGVIFHGANVEKLMQTIGVKSQTLKAGKFKEVGTIDREWTPYERAELEKVIAANYDMFCQDVASARDLNISDKERFADAHIFSAAQAKAVGLIDAVATLHEAKEALVTISGIKEPVWAKPDKFEQFMKKFANEGASLLHLYFPAASLR